MSIELHFPRAAATAAVLTFAVAVVPSARPQDAAQPAGTETQEQPAEEQQVEGNKEGSNDDAYAIPDGTPEELLKFVEKLLTTPPPDQSREGVAAHLDKVVKVAITATTRVMESSKATPDEAARAAEAKLQMLSYLARSDGEDADETLEKFKEQIRHDKRQAVRMVLMPQELLGRLANWQDLDDAGKHAWTDDVVKYLQEVELDAQDRSLVAYALNSLANTFDDKAAATELANKAIPLFEASDNETISAMADQLRGALRYMNLEGSQMTIQGTLLDSEPFDWSQYKDKVVLVDFWATWCGPCIRELPNVVENYERYHGKGFEVVGISLDTDAEKVKQFVADREIPWPILFSYEPDASGWEHPMAVAYGIQAIPAAVLVDKSGTVVTKQARGETLGKHLQELLGDPLPVEGESEPEADGDDQPE